MGEAKRRGTFEERKAQSVQKSGYFFTRGIDDEFGLFKKTTSESIIMQHIDQMPDRQSILYRIRERKRLNIDLPFIIRLGDGVIVFSVKNGFYMILFMGGTDAELLEKAERWKQNLLKSLNLAEK
jgi:hypothetical protein